jgi:hypothetical protein
MARKKLGLLLEKKGLVTEFQLVAALSHQRKWKIRLGKALLELGYIEEKVLFEVLAEQWGMELVDLYDAPITEDTKRKLSREKGMALMAMPVRIEDDTLVIAVSEPDRENLKQDLEKLTGMSVKLVMAMDSQIEELTRTLPEKVSVASVKPIKKAFRKNSNGEIEPAEEIPPDEILGGREIPREEPKKAEPLKLSEVELPPVKSPENLPDEPVELEEEAEEPEVPEKTEKPGGEGLAVQVPDIDLGAKQESKPPEAAPAKVEEKKSEPPAESEDFWEEAKTAEPAPEIAEPEKESPVEEETRDMGSFFPGQMREMNEPEPEPEPELKPEDKVPELKISEKGEPVELQQEVKEPEKIPEPVPEPVKTVEQEVKSSPLPPFLAEPPVEAPRQSIKPPDSPPRESKQMISGIEREVVLRKIMEIEQKLQALTIMLEELREKLQE